MALRINRDEDEYLKLPKMYRRAPEFYPKNKGPTYNYQERFPEVPAKKKSIVDYFGGKRGFKMVLITLALVVGVLVLFQNRAAQETGIAWNKGYKAEVQVRQGPAGLDAAFFLTLTDAKKAKTGTVSIDWLYGIPNPKRKGEGSFVIIPDTHQVLDLPAIPKQPVQVRLTSPQAIPPEADRLGLKVEWDGTKNIIWRPLDKSASIPKTQDLR